MDRDFTDELFKGHSARHNSQFKISNDDVVLLLKTLYTLIPSRPSLNSLFKENSIQRLLFFLVNL